MPPVRGTSLYKEDSMQFGAMNRSVFLNNSHRFNGDPDYGIIVRKFRAGTITKEDIQKINTRFVTNAGVKLPLIPHIQCACYQNDERNSFSNTVFVKHLEATHKKSSEILSEYPTHTCIIKSNMQHRLKSLGPISLSMHNRIVNECGDADIKNSKDKFVDPALKFFHGVPLMMNTNERIDQQLANGTSCIGLYIKV